MHKPGALLGGLGLAALCWVLGATPGLAQSPTPAPSLTPLPAPTPTDPVAADPPEPMSSPQPRAKPRPAPTTAAPASDSPADPAEMQVHAAADPPVSAIDNEFVPKDLSIAAGDTVTWTNDGQFVHTVTSDDGVFDSGPLDPGASFTFTFSEGGTHPYHCQIHGGPGGQGMSGTVVVAGAPQQPGDDGAEDPATEPSPASLPNTGVSLGLAVFGFVAVATGSVLLLIARR
jgi:plastocyanin